MKTIPIAVIGLNFGRHIIGELSKRPASDLFRLAAVCDINQERVRAVSSETGVPGFTDIGELLGQCDAPAIGLFTGPVGRAALIRQILEAGRHVITTKPFENDPEAAMAVLDTAREKGLAVHMNSPSPSLPPDLAVIRKWQESRNLGRPLACQTSVWVRYREKQDGSWYDDPLLCPVAPVFRLGIYLINDMVRLMGEAGRVSVHASRLFTGRPTDDHALLAISFRNGSLGSVMASFCVEDGDIYQNSMILNFERGTVYRNVGPTRRGSGRGVTELSLVMGTNETGRSIAAEHSCEHGSGAYSWEDFHRAVAQGPGHEDLRPEEIVAGLRIIEAMREASRSGGTSVVKPARSSS